MRIINLLEEINSIKEEVIYFDLDNTLTASVFTLAMPHPVMKLCGAGEHELRYTILRPGAISLLKCIKALKFPIGILTDAELNRAIKIVKQYGLSRWVDLLITQEILTEVKNRTGISEEAKPLSFYKGKYLFDDNWIAVLTNKNKSTKVKSFQAKLVSGGQLKCMGYKEKWSNWDVKFKLSESLYMLSLQKHVIPFRFKKS